MHYVSMVAIYINLTYLGKNLLATTGYCYSTPRFQKYPGKDGLRE